MTVRLFLILLCLAGAVTVGITLTVHQHDRAADALARRRKSPRHVARHTGSGSCPVMWWR
jgi:hypothetical protein